MFYQLFLFPHPHVSSWPNWGRWGKGLGKRWDRLKPLPIKWSVRVRLFMSGSVEKCLSSANQCPHDGVTCCGGVLRGWDRQTAHGWRAGEWSNVLFMNQPEQTPKGLPSLGWGQYYGCPGITQAAPWLATNQTFLEGPENDCRPTILTQWI